jgi:hypothetical protein
MVNCRDEVSFADPEPGSMGRGELGGNDETYVTETLEACVIWDVGQAPATADTAVVSDIDTLVLAGRFDPITPTYHGRAVADSLTSATYLEFGDREHGTLAEPCSDQIVLQFLAAPALVPIEVDLSGVDQPSLRSSAPGEWYEFDDGVWYRDRSFLDHSSLFYEAYPDSSVSEQIAFNLNYYDVSGDSQLPSPEIGGTAWAQLSFTSDANTLDIAIAEIDGITIVVTLVSHPAERGLMLNQTLKPVLAATRPR